jgi:hypothetical protein
MSDLSQLKAQLHAIASDAQSTSAQIATFQAKFSRAISEVQQRIGGSATGTDRQIIEVLDGAARSVRSATEALANAARSARSYADSL